MMFSIYSVFHFHGKKKINLSLIPYLMSFNKCNNYTEVQFLILLTLATLSAHKYKNMNYIFINEFQII